MSEPTRPAALPAPWGATPAQYFSASRTLVLRLLDRADALDKQGRQDQADLGRCYASCLTQAAAAVHGHPAGRHVLSAAIRIATEEWVHRGRPGDPTFRSSQFFYEVANLLGPFLLDVAPHLEAYRQEAGRIFPDS